MSSRGHPVSFHCMEDIGGSIEIDLQENFEIVRCKYINRLDCCQHRIIGATLSLLKPDRSVDKSYVITTDSLEINIDFT